MIALVNIVDIPSFEVNPDDFPSLGVGSGRISYTGEEIFAVEPSKLLVYPNERRTFFSRVKTRSNTISSDRGKIYHLRLSTNNKGAINYRS